MRACIGKTLVTASLCLAWVGSAQAFSGSATKDDVSAKSTGGTPAPSQTGGSQYGAALKTVPKRSRAEIRRARARKLRRLRQRRARRLASQRKEAAQKKQDQQPATTTAPTPTPNSDGPRFPVAGDHDFGGEDAGFGAKRTGHTHQGQDIMAVEGTPVVAPTNGSVYWRAYQAGGAGYYLILLDPARNRYYALMHLKKGSIVPKKGDTITAGQQIAQVGNTGRSFGAHLHFEIWEGGWYSNDAKAIDPLPDLKRWDGYS